MNSHLFLGRASLLFHALLSISAMLAFTAMSVAEPDSAAVLGKYKRFVFTVSAYAKVGCDTTGKRTEKQAKWRKNIGTAFPVGDRGYLITLNCVIVNAEKIEVTDSGGGRYGVSVVGSDSRARITVLKLDHAAAVPSPLIKPVGAIKSGCIVMFIGSSPGGALSVTPGLVSAVRRRDGMIIVKVIREPGTSGTPLFDENGEVIGLLAYHLDEGSAERNHGPEKKSYLVFPMEYASLQARSIINRFEAGCGWLGVFTTISALTVQDVVSGSPADKCGIKPGDRILEYNGSPVAVPEDLLRVAGTTHAGDMVRIRVMRNGEPRAFTARLSSHPDAVRK
jgi:serine protease Do